MSFVVISDIVFALVLLHKEPCDLKGFRGSFAKFAFSPPSSRF